MSLFDKDNQPLDNEQALQQHIDTALAATMPDGVELELAYQLVKRLFRPVISGAEGLPEQPCLFVGIHSLFALDGYILAPIMMRQLGRFVRGLGDKFLFTVPAVGNPLMKFGAVMGHPEVCAALMAAGQDLVVFPGGAHEAVKPAHQRYQLQWKERYGFVRLAAQHGYTIVPFGMVGPDEFYGQLVSGEDLPDTAAGALLRRLGLLDDNTRTDMLPPVPVGALGTLAPKPQRVYLGFGEGLDLSAYAGRVPTRKQQQKIRQQVADGIDGQLAAMLRLRAQRRGEDGLLRRLLTL